MSQVLRRWLKAVFGGRDLRGRKITNWERYSADAAWTALQAKYRAARTQLEELKAVREGDPPGLPDAAIERLAMLAEECGEVVQAVGKILRHGYESRSPYGGAINRVQLERELGDIRAVVNLMLDAGDVRLREIQAWQRTKREKIPRWTHHQGTALQGGGEEKRSDGMDPEARG